MNVSGNVSIDWYRDCGGVLRLWFSSNVQRCGDRDILCVCVDFCFVVDHVCCLQILREPCYDTLRTKQQLGYSVHSGVRLTHGILGFAVCVVSGNAYVSWILRTLPV